MEVKSSISRLIFKGEGVLRILCMVLLVTTACLARFDTETEIIFGFIKRKATFKDLDSLGVLVIVESVAAAYNFLQLSRWLLIIFHFRGRSSSSSPTFFNAKLGWFCFLLDQKTNPNPDGLDLQYKEEEILLATKMSLYCIRVGEALRQYISRYKFMILRLSTMGESAAYVSFGAVTAAGQASVLTITGARNLHWLKLKVCSLYTRFCFQIGGSLGCGFIASILMYVIACMSAFNLFRHYSSTEFLVLKSQT